VGKQSLTTRVIQAERVIFNVKVSFVSRVLGDDDSLLKLYFRDLVKKVFELESSLDTVGNFLCFDVHVSSKCLILHKTRRKRQLISENNNFNEVLLSFDCPFRNI
jgi:hypothetical protein